MTLPTIEIIPLKGAVRSDSPCTLDLLLRISPPAPPADLKRPPLNLGIVLDRSGSMAGHNKMTFAKEAAVFAVQQLAPTDRISVTVFDDKIETIAPNGFGDHKALVARAIAPVEPGGSTDLHGGWLEGAKQVGSHKLAAGLNRVLLLSDGQANMGVTAPDAIATDVSGQARQGVSTTTLGVGDDYNENLMEAMARSGDGNYYYIESPSQLPAIFQAELLGLMATFGNTVSFGVEPRSGTTASEVFNDFEPLPTGRWKLPNLIAGMPVGVALRLTVPAGTGERELCRFRLAWNAPGDSRRHTLTASLKLPSVARPAWDSLAPNPEVQEAVALLLIARDKKASADMLERGDRAGTAALMRKMRDCIAACPPSPAMQEEADAVTILEAQLANREDDKFQKGGKFQAYQRRQGKKSPT